MPENETTVATTSGPARLALTPGEPGVGLLVLTHGSAGSVDAPDLVALRGAAVRLGWTVAAVTQPFRLAGRRNPGLSANQDAAWREIVEAVHVAAPGPLVTAGRSNGARVACRTADDLGAVGVICLAFPVHPPGNPDKHRLDELEAAHCRVLVVQGDRDPFGMPTSKRGRRKVVVATGADHGLKGATAIVTREARTFLRAMSGHLS